MNPGFRCLIIAVAAAMAFGYPAILAQENAVPSRDGLVVTASGPASDAGAAVLTAGGNAVDAAVATAFALAVTYPTAGNIGGGGFMIVRTPRGRSAAFDFREKAPLRATRDMYLDSAGRIRRELTETGYLAPGVPGTVRGLEAAHREFGRLPWKDVVMPAVNLAENGFVVSESLARGLNREIEGPMKPYPASLEAYSRPGGGRWQAGDRIVLKDLGRTLRAIAVEGPDAFYRGWIADRIADDMKAHGGLISRDDLAAYRVRKRKPVTGKAFGYDILSMPPPSSGGTALIEMLHILERLDVAKDPRYSAETLHLVIEAMRRAFLDRARYLGDPDFGPVPVKRLTSKRYAAELARSIDRGHATSSAELGRDIFTASARAESEETTHLSVIDRDGMGVAMTYTLEGGYGSHVVVKGAGFILNNEMGDFNKKAGETNERGDIGTAPNLIRPGKRMLSSMTPTMVLRNGKLVMITGSPGGRTIINTVLGIVLNVTAFGMNGSDAVEGARMHHQWMPETVTLEENAVPSPVVEKLTALGHKVRVSGKQGDAESIYIDPRTGVPAGIRDRRSPDSKASPASTPAGSAQR